MVHTLAQAMGLTPPVSQHTPEVSELDALREEIRILRLELAQRPAPTDLALVAPPRPVAIQPTATTIAQIPPIVPPYMTTTATTMAPPIVSSHSTTTVTTIASGPPIASAIVQPHMPFLTPDQLHQSSHWPIYTVPPQMYNQWTSNRSRRPAPPFNKTCVDAWFRLLDLWFEDEGQHNNDAFKFRTTISLMDCQLLQVEFYEFLRSPPTENAYITLRTAVVKHFASSESERFSQLVSGIQLGDSRPSHLLTKLRKVASGCPESLLRNFWLQRLPDPSQSLIRMFAENNKALTLTELAEMADTSMNTGSSINVVSKEPAYVSELRKSIEVLSAQVKQMRSRSQSPKRNGELCNFHRRFRNAARNCEEHCTRWADFKKLNPKYQPKNE